jgi:hypothetical protein
MRVACYMFTDLSADNAVYTFKRKMYSFTFKKEVTGSFETSVNIYQTARGHIPGESNLHSDRYENLKSKKKKKKTSYTAFLLALSFLSHENNLHIYFLKLFI